MASLRAAGRRAADLGKGFFDTFLRDNRLLPPVLALVALFVFAWVLAGVFVGGTDEQKPVAHRSEIAQADDPGATDPAAPEVDNPNVDSYAAYRSKDPFRRLFVFARTTPEETTTGGETTSEGRPGGGGGDRRGADSDGDGLPDRKEEIFGQEPGIPDTDGDGIPDGLDDSNGNGIPDGVEGSAAGGTNNRAGGSGGGRGAGDRPGRGGGLLDSGGNLSPP